MSSNFNVCDLCAVVMQSKIDSLWDKFFKSPNVVDFRYSNIIDVSHVVEYLGSDGLILKIPFIYLFTISCLPKDSPFLYGIMVDNADLAEFTELYPTPVWK